jgi:hypothetical protein
VGDKLRGGVVQTLRLAAPVFALPGASARIAAIHPGTLIRTSESILREAHQTGDHRTAQAPGNQLRRDDRDEGTLPSEFSPKPDQLARVVMVPKAHRAKTADELLEGVAAGTDLAPLITLPNKTLPRRFRDLCSKRGMNTIDRSERPLVDLIELTWPTIWNRAVARSPGKRPAAGLRAIPIPELPPLVIEACRGKKFSKITAVSALHGVFEKPRQPAVARPTQEPSRPSGPARIRSPRCAVPLLPGFPLTCRPVIRFSASLEHVGVAARDSASLADWYTRVLGATVRTWTNGATPPAY